VRSAVARIKQIFEFYLSLEHVQPTVWRRILVPDDCTLARLHKVIQAVMNWQDYHLHEFMVKSQAYGDPQVDEDARLVDDRTVRLRNLDIALGDRVEYVYDFGDNWQHVLKLEDKMPPAAEVVYPLCVAGERSAPPEDVGGVSGYEEFLEAFFDPRHEEHEHMKSWIGRPFDPAVFSVIEANERLRKRLRLAAQRTN